MIGGGVLPSNEGRGYVLRRLLRRAARHGKLLGVNEPFLYQVCGTVIHENGGHYPELRERQDYITKVIRVEEENFAKTIDGGLKIFNEMLAGHKEKGEKTFSGADAFKLYDTYGFHMDLTLEMVEEQGMTLDEAEFHKQMEEQQEMVVQLEQEEQEELVAQAAQEEQMVQEELVEQVQRVMEHQDLHQEEVQEH